MFASGNFEAERNIVVHPIPEHDLRRYRFLSMTSEVQIPEHDLGRKEDQEAKGTKAKMNKWDYMNLEIFCTAKETINTMKRYEKS
ncbi:LINE-1 retrotransposable element ORF2 protein [Manis javanica]|nr:LINE-1 retrotransposable element ORF2 protein [Manis javanica]